MRSARPHFGLSLRGWIRRARRWLPRLAAVVGVTLATLAATDLVLSRFTALGQDPLKVDFPTLRGFGHCYRSRDPKLPIDLRNARDRKQFSSAFLGSESAILREGVTRCVEYDVRRRRLGSHPERPHQVAVVGDSFAFGEGVSDESTLGFLLADKFPTINFPNFASSGAGVNQVSDAVDRVLDDARAPTDIIYFYNINDVTMTDEMARRFSYLMDFENVRWKEVRRREHPDWLSQNSTLYKLLDRAAFILRMSTMTTRSYLDMYFDPVNAPALAETVSKIDRMVSRARERRVAFWVVLYPLMYKDFRGLYPFEPIHRMMMNTCARAGAGAIDGSEAFLDERRMAKFAVDPSDFHPNRLANQGMVNHLAETAGFLHAGWQTRTSRALESVRIPISGLNDSSPGVIVEMPGPAGQGYSVNGSMLSVELEAAVPAPFRLVLHAHASACRDGTGEEWPHVAVYIDDRRIDTVRIGAAESSRIESTVFFLSGRATMRLAFLNDYADTRCDRNVFVDSFDVALAQ